MKTRMAHIHLYADIINDKQATTIKLQRYRVGDSGVQMDLVKKLMS